MKIRNKMSLIIVPIILISIVAMNFVFDMFFQDYVLDQESDQLYMAKDNIISYLDSKKDKYQGNVCDWAHWDDTYRFALNENSTYEAQNIMESTFTNLNLSFLIIAGNDGKVQYEKYYSFQNHAFSDFPADFNPGFKTITDDLKTYPNGYGVFQIGSDFYFIAESDITDSVEKNNANAKLYFGRLIDQDIIQEIVKITGCTFYSIHSAQIWATGKSFEPTLESQYNEQNPYEINLSLTIPNPYNLKNSVKINSVFQRELYRSGMNRVMTFTLFSTIISIALAGVVIFLLWIFFTKPFTRMIKDVTNIDSVKDTLTKLPETGRDEFFYLKKTVNNLLNRIEAAQSELKDNKEKLQATLTSVGDGVITVDKKGRIQFLNPVAEKLTGWRVEEAADEPMEIVFNIINEYSRQQVESPVYKVFETDEIAELSNHTLLVSRDGTERPIEDTAAPIRDRNGETIGCVIVFRDFSEKKEKQRRIEYLSYHDQLTGLYNRRFFEEEVKRLDAPENLPMSFMYTDVNGLKTINDAFGHVAGDRFIQKIAEVFTAECRKDDIIARTGGDEFVILLPQTAMEDVDRIAEGIKKKVTQIKIMDVEISVSIGWDTKEEAWQDVQDVLKNAEDIMYQKKLFNTTSKRNGIIQSILNSLLVKSPREEAHSKRVSEICVKIGKAYGLSDDEIRELKIVGELHDIGKIAIDEAILNKQGKLTDAEWMQIKKHPETGYRLLGTSKDFSGISEYVLAHHEKWDGKGYPRGLKGEEIPWKARIISIADAYDAMISDRPYRKALTKEEAMQEIKKNSGTQFDPEIVWIFLDKVAEEV